MCDLDEYDRSKEIWHTLCMSYLVYGLIDPRTHLIRYVGKSVNGLSRPRMHSTPYSLKDRSYKNNWLRGLFASGGTYEIVILEDLVEPDGIALNNAERWWIAYGRALGWPLTNLTDGGDGASYGDANPSKRPEVAAKIRASKLGHVQSSETRARIGQANKGKTTGVPRGPMSPETKQKLSAAKAGKPNYKLRGRKASEAARAAISKGAKARWSTDEAQVFMRGPDNPSRKPGAAAKISAAAKARVRTYGACGTSAGYEHAVKFRRLGKEHCGPCELCMRAMREYYAGRRALKRKRLT